MRPATRFFLLVSAVPLFAGPVQAQPPKRAVDYCLTVTHIWTPSEGGYRRIYRVAEHQRQR